MTSLLLWVKRRCAKYEKHLPTQKKLFYVHPYNVVLNFTEFYKYLKIHECYWILNVQVLNSQSMTRYMPFSRRLSHAVMCQHDGVHKTGSTAWHIATPPEENRATAIGNKLKKIRWESAMSLLSYDRGQTNRHIRTDRHEHHSTPLLRRNCNILPVHLTYSKDLYRPIPCVLGALFYDTIGLYDTRCYFNVHSKAV